LARITLLTDFGTRDGYVGAMKGVMTTVYPGVRIDDISHSIGSGDVGSAALALTRYWSRYATGTVHLAVVDPGVGTERRALAVEADRRFFVAPDNGILSRVFEEAKEYRVVEIINPAYTLAGSPPSSAPEARGSSRHSREGSARCRCWCSHGRDSPRRSSKL
jgi:S-adenosylmethionine hydrolase